MRSPILIALVLWSQNWQQSVAQPKRPESPPNVLIIFTDDHRYDAIHALGNAQVKTPNIDQIIKNGVLFTRGYLQGANAGATCSPSRAQLLTGRGAFEIEHTNKTCVFPDTMISFPMAFREAGYHTFMTGKSHNGPDASMRGFVGGGSLYGLAPGYYTHHNRLAYSDFRADRNYTAKGLFFVGNKGEKITDPDNHLDHIGPHSSEVFAKEAVRFIENYKQSNPFLLYVAFHAPHDARNAPMRYHAMYPPGSLKLWDNYLPIHPFDFGEMTIRDEALAPLPRTIENTKQQLSDYYAIITHLDDQVGHVIQALRKSGRYDNTIIVFATDSGLGMGSHGLFGKQNLYDDAGIHVPIVFSGPGIPKEKRSPELCYTFDIFPTLCALTGVKIPASVTGKSLAKSIRGEFDQEQRQTLYFGYKKFQRAVRDKRYKLIQYRVNGLTTNQLFDLETDPSEQHDLATKVAYAPIRLSLIEKLNKHRPAEHGWGQEFWNQEKSATKPGE